MKDGSKFQRDAMTLRQFLFRSLTFHRRGNLAVLLGVAVGAAVITGALLVGDSLRGSLRDRELRRRDFSTSRGSETGYSTNGRSRFVPPWNTLRATEAVDNSRAPQSGPRSPTLRCEHPSQLLKRNRYLRLPRSISFGHGD